MFLILSVIGVTHDCTEDFKFKVQAWKQDWKAWGPERHEIKVTNKDLQLCQMFDSILFSIVYEPFLGTDSVTHKFPHSLRQCDDSAALES